MKRIYISGKITEIEARIEYNIAKEMDKNILFQRNFNYNDLLDKVENGNVNWRDLTIEDRDCLNAEWRAKYLSKNNG